MFLMTCWVIVDSTLTRAAGAEIDERGARDAPIVESLVLIEPGVLRRQDCELYVGR